jgi:hypothetical protein
VAAGVVASKTRQRLLPPVTKSTAAAVVVDSGAPVAGIDGARRSEARGVPEAEVEEGKQRRRRRAA